MSRPKRGSRRSEPLRATPRGYELAETAKDEMAATFWPGTDPANMEVYDPRPSQRIEPVGSWIMITRQLPAIEGRIDEHVRVGRIFFVERDPSAGEDGFLLNGTYKVVLHSPWGDVHLWPYEYATIPVDDVVKLWSTEEVVFHPIHIDDARFSEIAFYARTRGIGLADAAVMALGTMTGPVGWFEPRPDLAEECEAMERRVHTPLRQRFLLRAS